MNDDNLYRLAATLDSQSMTGACHRIATNPPPTDPLFKLAVDFLKSLRGARPQSGRLDPTGNKRP